MKEVSIIGLDLAKNSFQLHGACADGAVVFRKKLRRSKLLKFLPRSRGALLRWRPAPARIAGAERSANWGMMFV